MLVAVSSDAGFTPFRRVLHHNTEMFSSGKSINSSLDRLLRTINQGDKHAGQGAVKYFRKKKCIVGASLLSVYLFLIHENSVMYAGLYWANSFTDEEMYGKTALSFCTGMKITPGKRRSYE